MLYSTKETVHHLTLDDLSVNPQLARRLPQELACRYHALPVAEDNGYLTVAMANPDDLQARAALTTALGTTPYVVQSNQAIIDELLQELWTEGEGAPLRILIHANENSNDDELLAFGRALGNLLTADVEYCDREADVDELHQMVTHNQYDLVICETLCQPLLDRLIRGPIDVQLAGQLPASLLVGRNPRWPLVKILLVIRPSGALTSAPALEWVIRLAQPSGASVTALLMVPTVPSICDVGERMQPTLTSILSSDSALGKQMRAVAGRLAEAEIDGRLKLRQGPPDWQTRWEASSEDYDLIVLTADPEKRWLRWLMGSQVNHLLRWADRPVLIAKKAP